MCRLNGYLAKIGAVEIDICECSRGSESVDHFLFKWLEERQTLFNLARKTCWWSNLSFALGGWSNERKDGTLLSWKPSQEMASATIKFAIATHRLSDQKEERELEPRTGKAADGNEDLQSSSAEENHDVSWKKVSPA